MTVAPLHVVIVPDSFKGSCSAADAAQAIAAGTRAALGGATEITMIPLADGGEGTLEALTAAWGSPLRTAVTRDALGRDRQGTFGLSPDGSTAVIEAAEANGLPHVADLPLQALDADSFGVGLLVRAALDAGATELLVCLGGSATSDGGAGMLRALGVRLLRADGSEIPAGARGLAELARVDESAALPAARTARWRFAVDVTNPLTGPEGAAAVFGPQKGATPADVRSIDVGLATLARVLTETATSATVQPADRTSELPGLGAAGGIALGPVTLWGAELVPGAELVAEAVGLDASLHSADFVFTGEGRLDSQSLHGKVVSRVLSGALGAPRPPRVVVLAGGVALSAEACRAAGITAALSIATGPAQLAELQADARRLLSEAAAHASSLLAPPRG